MPVTEPSVITVTINGTIDGGEVWANVLHISKDDNNDLTVTEANDINDALGTLFDSMDGRRADIWHVTGWVVRQETSTIEFVYDATNDGALANPMPFDSAIVVSWSGTPNNRRTRGRTYLNGFSESHNDGGVLSATEQAAIADEWQEFANTLNGVDLHMCVWSNVNQFATRSNKLRVGQKWDTQRKRDNKIAESYEPRTINT